MCLAWSVHISWLLCTNTIALSPDLPASFGTLHFTCRMKLEGLGTTLLFYKDKKAVPYSTFYKPMGDLPYISSEQGGLIIHNELIYEYTIYKRPIPVQESS